MTDEYPEALVERVYVAFDRVMRSDMHLQVNVREKKALRAALAASDRDELVEALDYVYEHTYCGRDAEWHFKPGYNP